MSAPTEYVIIGFEGNEFNGEIVPEIVALIEAGLIRIVDVLFISKGLDGSVVALEVDEHESLSMVAALDGEVGGVIGPADIEHAAASIEGGSSVLLIVWESLWSAPLANAIRRAGGSLLEGGRIPAGLLESALSADAG